MKQLKNYLTINPKNSIGVLEARILYKAIGEISERGFDDDEKKTIAVVLDTQSTLAELNLNYDEFIGTTMKLLNFRLYAEDSETSEIKATNLVSCVKVQEEQFRVDFFKTSLTYLFALKQFMDNAIDETKIRNIIRLTHIHSILLYSLVSKSSNKIKITMGEMLRILGISEYVDFETLRNTIIEPAILEVNEKTDINISCAAVIKNHKIVAIEFSRNEGVQLSICDFMG